MSKDEKTVEPNNTSDDSIASRKRGRPRKKKRASMISGISVEENNTSSNGVSKESATRRKRGRSPQLNTSVSPVVHSDSEDSNSHRNGTSDTEASRRSPKSKSSVLPPAQSDDNISHFKDASALTEKTNRPQNSRNPFNTSAAYSDENHDSDNASGQLVVAEKSSAGLLEESTVRRKRGRLPKSIITPVSSAVPGEDPNSHLNGSSNGIEAPRRRRGRPPKLQGLPTLESALNNETNCHTDDASIDLAVPQKHPKSRKRKNSATKLECDPNPRKCESVLKGKKSTVTKSNWPSVASMLVNSKESTPSDCKSKMTGNSNQVKLFPIFNSPGMTNRKCDAEADRADAKFKSPCLNKNEKHKMCELNSPTFADCNKRGSKSAVSLKSQHIKSAKSDLRSFINKLDNAVDVDAIVNIDDSRPEKTESVINFNNIADDIDVVTDVIQCACLKVQEMIDCSDNEIAKCNDLLCDNNLALAVKYENYDTLPDNSLKCKNKRKKKKSIINICDAVSLENDLEVSSIRKSLRSRGAKSNLVNYSEIDSPENSPQKQGRRSAKILKQPKIINVVGDRGILDSSVKTPNVCSKVSLKNRTKSENVQKKLKLFPIFTPNASVLDKTESMQSSCKRKTSCDEVIVEEDVESCVIVSNSKKHEGKRKVSFTELGDKNLFTEQNMTSDNQIILDENVKNHNSEKLFGSMKTAKIKKIDNKQSEESRNVPIINVDDEIFIEELVNKNIEKNSSLIISQKKSNKSDAENHCFPKLSHLNVTDVTFPDTPNKFFIDDEDPDCSISAPSWNGVEGFVDAGCVMAIKCLGGNNLVMERKPAESSNYAKPSTNVYEEDESDLWTDSSQDSVTKEKVNEATVKQIKSWLLEWRDKFCRHSERKATCRDSESYSSSDSEDDDLVSNSIIIHGVPGSGKTSLVFSLANELGFKVLEVNASSSRSGRNISHQLKEALESYHMESIKVDDAFESEKLGAKGEGKSRCRTSDIEKSKVQPKNIKSFFEAENRSVEKKSVKSNGKKQSIANFFQVSNNAKNGSNAKLKEKHGSSKLKKVCDQISDDDLEGNSKSDKSSYRISSLTIILFDDVDIVFEEDEGFWGTVKGFLKISKKPVIFTVSRNLSVVKSMLNTDIEIFNMIPSSKETAIKTLKSYCKVHSRESTTADLKLLTSQNPCDLRRNILNAQFWTKNPNYCSNKIIGTLSNSGESTSQLVRTNTFLVGDFNFSANHIRKLLFEQMPYFLLSTVQEYHSLGYDILHNNLFEILGISDSVKHEKVWTTLSNSRLCKAKTFSDSQMWEEACEIFKQKKAALRNGSSAADLMAFSDVVENFSFADTLKGASSDKFQWIPVSERIKMWTAGLPICWDHSSWSRDEILHIVSLIHIYTLRKFQSAHISESASASGSDLVLEHPFAVDRTLTSEVEEDLMHISSALPVSQFLNKVALSLDYLSMIKIMCQEEQTRQLHSGKRSGRFLHYFDSISFLLEKRTF